MSSIEPRLGSPSERPGPWRGTTRYRLVRRIGEGAMGVVYEALDTERGQLVAIKTLLRSAPELLYHLKQEFRALADLQHPNLVRLHELVVNDPDPAFFAMELVRGPDFLGHVRKPATRGDASPADLDKLVPALRQLVGGVRAVHAAGKLHRDIKPANVLVTANARIVLLDFGLATELSPRALDDPSHPGEFGGSAHYMSPEQACGEPLSPAADWYAVGAMLYEALVGRTPFIGSTVEVLTAKCTLDPPLPSETTTGIPRDLDALCRALLDRDPCLRPTATEILERLGAHDAPAAPTPVPERGVALLGREKELEVLRDGFRAVQTGRSVTVRVSGATGMGKSALMQRFLDEVAKVIASVVLRGRTYQRESVPYKAVDGAIDELSRHMIRAHEGGAPLELPREVDALARIFPVLRRVPGVGQAQDAPGGDLSALRRRAFDALRDLLSTYAARGPLVIFLDDVQWGDADSAAMLVELMRPPGAPALLLVLAYRDEDAPSAFLKETGARWSERAEVRNVSVGPLEEDDAARLAAALLGPGRGAEASASMAREIARECGGCPFLVEELARSAGDSRPAFSTGLALSRVSLPRMVRDRLERLDPVSRRIVEAAAVGGRPLPVALVGEVAQSSSAVDEAIALLADRRLVRASLHEGREMIEVCHDRIRETIYDQLEPGAARAFHERFARVLEATPGTDAESLLMHLLGCGDTERAARQAEMLADHAATKLAFDQGARLYRLALESSSSVDDARRLRSRLAEVLEWAGRGAEAAQVYLDAAERAPPAEAVELQRAAAEQLLASGRIDEGAEGLRRVLAGVGVVAPRSPIVALLLLVVYRLLQVAVGFGFKEREADDVHPDDRLCIDALYSAAMNFSMVNVIVSACMQARHLLLAMRKGDAFQILRATSLEATHLASAGGSEGRREKTLVDLAARLAEREVVPERKAYFQANRGVSLFLRGHWREARDRLDVAFVECPYNKAGWHSNANVFAVYSLIFLGELREVAQRQARLISEAELGGDLYTSVHMQIGHTLVTWLAADEPETARRRSSDAMACWSQSTFYAQHWLAMLGEADVDLYAGEGVRAYERLRRDAPALRRSLLERVQFGRAMTTFVRGRSAVSCAALDSSRRGRLVAEARRMARRLERENAAWTVPFARILAGAAANAEGDQKLATARLREAIEAAESTSMPIYAACARRQLGCRLGGSEGAELLRRADDAMTAEGIRSPVRFAGMVVPGRWD
jgi:eukaryotic-like serine/threonine-protein kinase